jgi:hypothetical protein
MSKLFRTHSTSFSSVIIEKQKNLKPIGQRGPLILIFSNQLVADELV